MASTLFPSLAAAMLRAFAACLFFRLLEISLLLEVGRSVKTETGAASESSSLLRICIHAVPVVMLVVCGYGFYWLMQKDSERQQQFKSFVQDASVQLRRSNDAYSAIQNKYTKLRTELFNEHNHGSCFDYASLKQADEASADDCSVSWQRALPDAAKQKLKAALVKWAIAIIPRYEETEREVKANRILFDQRLIADVHWQAVKGDHEDTCSELMQMIQDGNCLEEGWGSRSDGLFLTARTILQHEAVKERVEQEKRKAEAEREKEALRLEKQKKEEREKQARQQKKAAEALELLLEETEAVSRKKEGKELRRR